MSILGGELLDAVWVKVVVEILTIAEMLARDRILAVIFIDIDNFTGVKGSVQEISL